MNFLTSRLDFILRRILWPLVIAVVTYFACQIIIHDKRISLGIAALPLALGFIGVFARYAYMVAALTVIAAVIVSVTTPKQRVDMATSGGNILHGAVDRMNSVVGSEAARAKATGTNRESGEPPHHRRHVSGS